MKLKCLHCEHEFDGTVSYDELGWHSSCPECGCSFDVDIDMENLKSIARYIVEDLEHCSFDDIADSSGYYIIREFDDGTDRAVDVHKSTFDGKPHYVVYCSYEDEDFDYIYTDDLSVEQLLKVLEEFYMV